MKKFKISDILLPVIVLTAICLVTSGLLAYTNSLTAPIIEKNNIAAANATKAVVLAAAADFADEAKDNISYSVGTDASGTVVGYVFTTTAKSYGGEISVMVGVNADGTVSGVELLSINDTPGLGMNAKNPNFLKQFVGKVAGIIVNKNEPAENEIKALTGATVTSKAVTEAVNKALADYAKITGGVNND